MPSTYPTDVVIEKTPNYMDSEITPARVYNMSSKTKIIAIFRDPVQRAVSHWVHNKNAKRVHGDIYNSFLLPNGTLNTKYLSIRRGIYYRQLENWYRFFPKEQVLLLDGEKLTEHPVSLLNKVEAFLGVPTVISRKNIVYDKQKGFYCKKIKGKVKCLSSSKGRSHPHVRKGVLKQMYDYYRPFNKRLYELTKKNFTFLKY